jgi:hypothetical protein
VQIIACPEPSCSAPAEIVDRWVLESTDGPIEHVKTRCLALHIFTPRVETLADSAMQVPGRRSRTG